MKILLTIFVLLFSSSVVAGDDLTGKKILCMQILEEGVFKGEDYIKIDAFDFKDNKIVENTFKYNGKKNTFVYLYEAQIRNIFIYLPNEDNSKRFLYELNRKNLTLTSIGKNTREVIYYKESCNLVKGDLYSLIDDKEENYRKKIKLENQL